MVLLALSPTVAEAVPPIPSSFYGTVKLNGSNVPNGTKVSAWIGGVKYAETETETWQGDSVYSIDVPGDDPDTPGKDGGVEGETIVFKIASYTADQTGTWHSGTSLPLNLTAEEGTVTITPTSTFTPTPTNTPTRTPTPTPTGTRTPIPTEFRIYLPLIVKNYSSSPQPQIELFYDDGEADFGFVTSPGGMGAVKFTVSSEAQIRKLKFYIGDEMKNVRVHVLGADFDSIFSREVTPSEGWFEVDISSDKVFVSGDFYVGWQWITECPNGPWLGVDNTPPHHQRSYVGTPGGAPNPVPSDEDYMIRAVVGGPVTPTPTLTPTPSRTPTRTSTPTPTPTSTVSPVTRWFLAGSRSDMERASAAMVYDAHRGVVVLFGGRDGGERSDTWEYDGSTWTQVSTAHTPPARYWHNLAYAAQRRVVVLFGGEHADTWFDDTWEYDGTDWRRVYTAHSPSAREGFAVAYDACRQRVVLFGGDSHPGIESDTWEYDGSDWVQVHTPTSPPARKLTSMVHDPVRCRMILFGGLPSGPLNALSDTWEYDGANWTQRHPTTSPPSRWAHAMAYDSDRGRVISVAQNCG